MDSVRQYLLSVIAAAIISGITVALINKNAIHSAIIKLLCGLFMVTTVMSPLTKLDLTDLQEFSVGFSADAKSAVDTGVSFREHQLRENITQQAEAYIQKRAKDLGADLTIDVELTEEIPPVPLTVTLSGAVSPYAKNVLCHDIENNLDIPEEKQVWM